MKGLNLQNIQAAHAALYKTNKQTNKKKKPTTNARGKNWEEIVREFGIDT